MELCLERLFAAFRRASALSYSAADAEAKRCRCGRDPHANDSFIPLAHLPVLSQRGAPVTTRKFPRIAPSRLLLSPSLKIAMTFLPQFSAVGARGGAKLGPDGS